MIKKFPLVLVIAFLISCVPARKYEEVESKQKVCSEKLKEISDLAIKLETDNTELKAGFDQMNDQVRRLKSDTTLLGKALRIKEKQYDKIDLLNQRIQDQLESLQKGSAIENQRLISDLDKTRLELQRKEDELRLLEIELNQKKFDLDKLSADLKDRELRVRELEQLIANKDAMVKALKEKVANALLGFKDKGLTVEQKNGKVYISMEAKLLFGSGSTQVDPEGQKALIELAKILEEQEDLEVLVEGHTDTDKMNSGSHPKDNWELSVLRATSVVKIMLKHSEINPVTITAAGRSEFLPVEVNDKSKNRRIEVILIPKLDELFEIISKDN
ncbi:MAG: OmpA family protein [Flavobacteriales bacterium]|nr:OmpA family protein [Flavobacteriales bacterium]